MSRTIAHPLRRQDRPAFTAGDDAVRLVDLFAGCGGLTLGVAQAAHSLGARVEVPLAVDLDAAALAVYTANFPGARTQLAAVEAFFDGELGNALTPTEARTADNCGHVDLLVGGPPCQGHSNLNNRTRRDDPKNALYSRMARAAEVLQPELVLIENVPAVEHDRGNVVQATSGHLKSLGYEVGTAVLGLHALGVAQTRRRHVLLASKTALLQPIQALTEVASREVDIAVDLRWAIEDLETVADPRGYDVPAKASPINLQRMQYLLENNLYDLPNEQRPLCHRGSHSYTSMYGRLRWDRPAQTVTSGFGSIGQGRYMHPSQARALTAHEAARLQGFPDYFRFDSVTKRGALATMIGNAVPPALSREISVGPISRMFLEPAHALTATAAQQELEVAPEELHLVAS